MREFRAAVVAIIMLGLAACNRARVQTEEAYVGPQTARPDRVLVAYFAIAPEQVRLDQGIGARIIRTAGDQPLTALQLQAAQKTQAALARKLIDDLRQYGLPAQRATGAPMPGTSVLVQGQIVSIDQGNRTRRILIGLGAGKSSVSADAQLYYVTGTGTPRFLTAFQGEADSGRMPGAAATMGVGAAAGTLATSAAASGAMHATSETRNASDTREAGNLADGIARQIAGFAVSQGWIAPTSLQQ
jgi:hypothetical protein